MPAANDHLDDALVLVGDSGETVLDFTGADYMEPGEEDWWGGQHKSLWFLWTASFTGVARFVLTDGAPRSWDVVVFANRVGWNFDDDGYDDIAWSDQLRARSFSTVAGTTYLLFADDYSYESGSRPRTAAVLSWQLLPFGTAGAMIDDHSQAWLPLHRREFSAIFDWLVGYPFPTADPPFDPSGQPSWTVGQAPDGSRLVDYHADVLEITAAGDVVLQTIGLPVNSGYAEGWGGGGGLLSETVIYALGSDIYGNYSADPAGRTFVGELVMTYEHPSRRQRYRPPALHVPLSPAPVTFSVLSDEEAAGAYAHFWRPSVIYHRSRPGDVEPTAANTGPFGNRYCTIHAVAGTQVGISGGGYGVYSSHYGVLESRVTGVGDDSWKPSYGYIGLVGPNASGVTESVVTLRSHYPGNPAAKAEFSFSIVWE